MASPDPPALFLGRVTAPADLPACLRLIPDSIAQQRQLAVRAIVAHPTTLAAVAAALAAVVSLEHPRLDTGTRLLAAAAVGMIVLLAARAAAGGYISAAEAFRVREYSTPDDVVFGARLGEGAEAQWVGVLVLRMDEQRKRGVVRAWTTKLRYRRRGLGGDMAALAVEEIRRRCGEGAVVVVDEEHANSKRALPGMYNTVFDERERSARRLLARAQEGTAQEKTG
jgi:hypothetical protein